MKLLLLLPLAVISLLTSCGSSVTSSASSHEKFVKRADYKQTYETYKNEDALKTVDTTKTKLRVNIATQRMIVSQDDTVLLDTPCTTGRAGKRTPTGTFKLYDKQADKRSNVYGTLYKNGSRVCGGHRYDRCSGVSYDKFVGSSLPYWQRLTGDGIGLHASNSVKRYAASGGCIRVQPAYAKQIFGMTKKGTPITVTSL
ncbi:MAG: L,D-transpeptidase [Akkermansiaceae bacterium]